MKDLLYRAVRCDTDQQILRYAQDDKDGGLFMSEVLDLARELIGRASVTPDDAGCQALIAERLQRAGFACEHLRHGAVDNLWATHGTGGPVLVLLGHTDVVPPGPREAWASDPFVAEVRDGVLYGRGAADMKGSVAAFVVAAERFAAAHPRHAGTLALLLTSDEEGDAIEGVRRVAETFRARGQRIDWCVTGEPSSKQALGDLLRVGRRGSLSARLTVRGIQGHVAYPDKARNPIHQALPVLAELTARRWDDGYESFPPTSLQVSDVHAGTGANNVIPGELQVLFNLRYNPSWDAARLEAECEAVLKAHALDYAIHWHRSGEPFHTPEGPLRAAAREVLTAFAGSVPEESTGGGTSDARFIAPLGAQCIEIGPVNASIHKVDEHVALADLERLPDLYLALVGRLLL
jgi:succinyl-diaminopimelate desuccinylase